MVIVPVFFVSVYYAILKLYNVLYIKEDEEPG